MFELRQGPHPANKTEPPITFLVCSALEKAGFIHGFSTRYGGISYPPQQECNLSFKQDEKDVVLENRRRFLAAIGHSWPIAALHQIHSKKIWIYENGANLDETIEGDAIIGNQKNVFLAVKTADCVPILLGDPNTGAMAAVHAGWRGLLNGVLISAINKLKEMFSINAGSLVAAVGPHAKSCCYEIGDEVKEKFEEKYPTKIDSIVHRKNSSIFLNQGWAVQRQLEEAGCLPNKIFISDACTIHQPELYFSHRRDGKELNPVGRMMAIIGRK